MLAQQTIRSEPGRPLALVLQIMGITAPAIAMHFLFCPQHGRPDRIEMHIIAHLPQIVASASIHQERFVSTPKEMAAKTVTSVELLGVRAKKPLHPCAQVAARGFHHQMKMIAHQTIGMNLPTRAPTRPRQQLKE